MGEMKKFVDIQNVRLDDIDLNGGKVRKNNVSGFQIGDSITITEKVDGSNASVRLIDGEIKAYSRNKELTFDNGLNGFYNYAQTLDKRMFTESNEEIIIFGEWMGNTDKINKITYKTTKGKWIIYSIYSVNKQSYLSPAVVKSFCNHWGLEYVHEFYDGPFNGWNEIKKYLHMNSYGDRQEGVVVRNESLKLRNMESERGADYMNGKTPYILKIVNEDFAESMATKIKVVDPEKVAARARNEEIMKTVVTENRMEKILGKAIAEGELQEEIEPKDLSIMIRYMGKTVFEDIIKEEKEVVESVGEDAGKICSKIVAAWCRKKVVV